MIAYNKKTILFILVNIQTLCVPSRLTCSDNGEILPCLLAFMIARISHYFRSPASLDETFATRETPDSTEVSSKLEKLLEAPTTLGWQFLKMKLRDMISYNSSVHAFTRISFKLFEFLRPSNNNREIVSITKSRFDKTFKLCNNKDHHLKVHTYPEKHLLLRLI